MTARRTVSTSLLPLACALALAACGNTGGTADTGNNGGDTGNNGGDSSMQGMDGGMDGGTMLDDSGRRQRDTGQEINLFNEGSVCLVQVTPSHGGPNDTYNIVGSGLPSGTVTLIVAPPGGGTPLVNMDVTVGADGGFMYAFAQPGLALGDYTVHVQDPSFTCSFDTMFHVQ